ncbi:MAG: hypothetical protein V2A65_02440 [Candidatus Omnitrophota bacterium]
MKALRYKLDVYDSVLNSTHGFAITIEEIFVPEEKAIFNTVDGELHAWSESKPRCSEKAKLQAITVSTDFAKQLKTFIELKGKCFKKAKTYFHKSKEEII